MIYRRIVWKRLDEKTVKARQRRVEGTIYAPSMDFRLLMQDYRAGTMHDSLPARVLWGSFVTHSFLPDGGELKGWRTNPRGRIWPILLQLWSPSFCTPRLEYSSSRAYYLLYSFHFYHFLPLYVFHGIWTVKFDRLLSSFREKKGVYVWSSWLSDNWLYLKMKFSIRHSIWLEINSPWLFANFPLHSFNLANSYLSFLTKCRDMLWRFAFHC